MQLHIILARDAKTKGFDPGALRQANGKTIQQQEKKEQP
jgi:hypothetical protein